MSGTRPWGAYYFRQDRGAPFYSLGIHVDFHTPRVELYLPRSVLSVGRIRWWGRQAIEGDRMLVGGRVAIGASRLQWSGHSDDCDHPRPDTGTGEGAGEGPADAGEYGRLLAERDRLIGQGVDPADLLVPDAPEDTAG